MSRRNVFFTLIILALLAAGLFFAQKLQQETTPHTSLHALDTENQPSSQVTNQNSTEKIDTPIFGTENLNTIELEQWKIIENILIQKNDNDPSLDQVANQLSDKMRLFLQAQYKKIPAENLNERGTLIYIIAKNTKSLTDLDFLKSVLSEPPCLSLSNCEKLETSSDSDNHHEDTNMTTLAYPQLVALYEIDKNIEKNSNLLKDNNYRNEIIDILNRAENFPVQSVQQKSRRLREKYKL